MESVLYCKKRMSNNLHCGKLATHKTTLAHKSNLDQIITDSAHRCDEHKTSATVNKRAVSCVPFNQDDKIREINKYLISLIGKKIKSSAHTARELEVKFLKGNCAVMCYQSHSKKWKFVYYHQVVKVF